MEPLTDITSRAPRLRIANFELQISSKDAAAANCLESTPPSKRQQRLGVAPIGRPKGAATLLAAVVLCVVSSWCAAVWAAQERAVVRVYLPETLRVDSSSLELGQVCIVRCDDEQLAQRASAVALGRSPWSKEQLVLDRQTILSRLASSGIKSQQVQFSGAAKVVIERDEVVVAAKDLLASAERFLQESRPGPAGCMWKLERSLRDVRVPAAKGIKIQARQLPLSQASYVKLELAIIGSGSELGKVEALFKVMYAARQAVAAKDLSAGTVLAEDNIRIENVPSEVKPAEAFVPPYGMTLARAVQAGEVIPSRSLMPPKPVLLVKRSQAVTMRVRGDGFLISAAGEAMDDGRGGDFIKVRNVDTKRVVICKVNFDGTVEPSMGETGK